MALEDIAGYSLRRTLGSGSAGAVWLVRDRASGRNAVLKRIPITAISDPEEFCDHLKILQRLDHPHLARLHDFRETADDWLLISRYVAAGTLSALLGRRGPLAPGELVTLLTPLADALTYLHRTGLTHGRVTPTNILFDTEGRPVLTDPALHPATPADDLKSLADVAHQSGADPTLFTPDRITDPQSLLTIATPAPINLAFTEDPTTAESPTKKPAPPDDPVEHPRTPLPPRPPKPTAAPTISPKPPQAPMPKPLARTTKPSRRNPSRPNRARPSPPNRLDRLTTPTGAADHATRTTDDKHPGTNPVWNDSAQRSPIGLARLTRRRSRHRPWRRSHTRWRRHRRPVDPAARIQTSSASGTTRPPAQKLIHHPVRRHPVLRNPAYGVLAAAALGAVVVLILGLLTVGALDNNPAGTAAATNQTPTPTDPTPPTPPGDPAKWTRTLQALDTQRAKAFWTLDPTLLDTVYVPGTVPWKADQALLATYRKHQIRVRNLNIHISNTTVEAETPTKVVLHITDHLTTAQAITPTGTTTNLPPATPTSRRLTLTKTPTTPAWRITAIAPA
ncbi:protein kinase domain-containing protein [Kribbella sp. NPDC002412]